MDQLNSLLCELNLTNCNFNIGKRLKLSKFNLCSYSVIRYKCIALGYFSS